RGADAALGRDLASRRAAASAPAPGGRPRPRLPILRLPADAGDAPVTAGALASARGAVLSRGQALGRRVAAAWTRFFHRPEPVTGIALFRILWGGCLLANWALLAPDLFTWLCEPGVLSRVTALALTGPGRYESIQALLRGYGTAVYNMTRLVEFERFPLPPLFDHLWAIRAATWGSLLVEAALATLVWVPRLRYPVLAAGAGLHLGVEYAMNVPLFQWLMLACLTTFVPPAHVAAVARRVASRTRP